MTIDAPRTPPAEARISEASITRLIAQQFSELAHLPVTIVGEGWDNVMARVGDKLAARMPRHKVGETLLKREQRWLPTLAPRLPLPVPSPVHIGTPDGSYPFTWSVVEWIDGECADTSPPVPGQGSVFSEFLLALHHAAPDAAPKNGARDCPLA